MKKWMRGMAMAVGLLMVGMCLAGCGAKDVEESQEPTATPAPTVAATPVPTPTPELLLQENGFTFERMDEVMFTTANLNVRSLPNVDGGKIGMFHKGAEVEVSGRCVETGWYRVEYNGQVGYCSDEYLE